MISCEGWSYSVHDILRSHSFLSSLRLKDEWWLSKTETLTDVRYLCSCTLINHATVFRHCHFIDCKHCCLQGWRRLVWCNCVKVSANPAAFIEKDDAAGSSETSANCAAPFYRRNIFRSCLYLHVHWLSSRFNSTKRYEHITPQDILCLTIHYIYSAQQRFNNCELRDSVISGTLSPPAGSVLRLRMEERIQYGR